MFAVASPDTWEVISIISSVVSIALAGFAIWQATTFYRWSSQASKDSENAAASVGESVRKLEDLFNRLYSDTFNMMRDTVSDMRKHVWPTSERGEKKSPNADALEEVERRASDNVDRLRDEMQREMRALVETIGSTSDQVSTIETSLASVLDRAIKGSREAEEEAQEETARSRLNGAVRHQLRRGRTEVEADLLMGPLFDVFDTRTVHRAMFALRDQGIIDFDGEGPYVEGPDTPIKLLQPVSRGKRRAPDKGGGQTPGGVPE